MRSGGSLAVPALLLALFCPTSSEPALDYFAPPDDVGSLPGRVVRQYDDMDYDSFIGLMGRRSTGTNAGPPLRRDTDDIFVGLLGRRSSDSGNPLWSGERRGALFRKNGKLRFRHVV